VKLQVSVDEAAVPDDVVPVTAVDDPADATALVDALGRDGAFAELVDAAAAAYDLPAQAVADHLEADLHCTRAWADESAVSNAVFQTRIGGDADGLRSERLYADDVFS
jgi:hypothetical protein